MKDCRRGFVEGFVEGFVKGLAMFIEVPLMIINKIVKVIKKI